MLNHQLSALVVLKCYDWAIEQREKRNCVISSSYSQIEKDVLHIYSKAIQTADTRNKVMIDLADQITIGYASLGGQLEELLKRTETSVKKIV